VPLRSPVEFVREMADALRLIAKRSGSTRNERWIRRYKTIALIHPTPMYGDIRMIVG